MILPQVVYGSITGSRDYDIIASSPDVSPADYARISNYSNLGGSAQVLAEEARSYAFYPLDGEERWVFAQTAVFGYGKRGNEYLVHALVLDRQAMTGLGGDVFALARAGAFRTWKPPQAQEVELRSVPDDQVTRALQRPFPAVEMPVASLLTALAGQRIAVCVDDAAAGRAVCETVHRTLPPSDRSRVSFCTYFSYPKVLAFDLAAFVLEDTDLVNLYFINRGGVYFDPSAAPAAAAVEGWVSRQPDRESLWGLSLLDDAPHALAVEERIGTWHATAMEGRMNEVSPFDDTDIGRDAAAVMGLPENADAPSVRALAAIIPAALLLAEVRLIVAGGTADVLRLTAIVRSLPDATARLLLEAKRTGATQATEVVETTKVIVWLADAHEKTTLDTVLGGTVAQWLASLHALNPRAALGLLTHVFGVWHASTSGGLDEIVDLTIALSGKSELLRTVAAAAEAAATGNDPHWLLRVLRELREQDSGITATALARLALDHGLLPLLLEHEVAFVIPELLSRFAERFHMWATTAADIASFREYAALATGTLLLQDRDWTPFLSEHDAALIAWLGTPAPEASLRNILTRACLLYAAALRIDGMKDRVRARSAAKLLAPNVELPIHADALTHQLAIRTAICFARAGAAGALQAGTMAGAIERESTGWNGGGLSAEARLAASHRVMEIERAVGATGAGR